MKTQAEIEKLKQDWSEDPCWDIEETEGFEDHKEELAAFSKQKHAEWEKAWRKDMLELAKELGVPGNIKLAEHFSHLLYRISELEERLNALELHDGTIPMSNKYIH